MNAFHEVTAKEKLCFVIELVKLATSFWNVVYLVLIHIQMGFQMLFQITLFTTSKVSKQWIFALIEEIHP